MDLRTQRRRRLILDLLGDTHGRFITVDFTKVDGTFRRMTCSPDAVVTHLTGCSSEAQRRAVETRQRRHPQHVPVYDVVKKGIRSVNLDTISRVVIDGVPIEIGGVL